MRQRILGMSWSSSVSRVYNIQGNTFCLSVRYFTPRLITSSAKWLARAGYFAPYAAEIKDAVDVPVIVAGKLDDPVFANRVLEVDKADLIAIGRGILADPYLPKKAQEGRIEEINQCTYCNVCHSEHALSCPINPELGQ